MNVLIVVVFLYPLVLIGVSLWRARTVKSHADFMVAGRSVPVPLLVEFPFPAWATRAAEADPADAPTGSMAPPPDDPFDGLS